MLQRREELDELIKKDGEGKEHHRPEGKTGNERCNRRLIW